MAMTEGRVSKLEDRLTKLFNQTRKEKKIGNKMKRNSWICQTTSKGLKNYRFQKNFKGHVKYFLVW